jgi:4-amino-4-deoxy-L-arabinose transferase-like glycosyltransferase
MAVQPLLSKKSNMKTRLHILFLIIILAFAVRVVGLGARPVGFTWDEAALGYNAYSLLETGKDEYGQIAPIVFRSFGDYKPGLYIYFTVSSIAIFGLTEFATRLPSAIFGTLLLPVVYVLTKLLFPKNKLYIEHFTLFILSLNPWLINFSRGAWEANLSLLLTVLGVTLFLRGFTKLSFIFFGLTFWTYQSAKLMTPLLLLSLLAVYKKKYVPKNLLAPFLLFLLLLLPILLNFKDQSGRLKVFSVFSYRRQASSVEEILKQDTTASKNLTYYLFHSESLDQLRGVLQRYLNHLSPRFLFSEGDWTNLRHSVYKHGYFYFSDVIILAIGLIYLIKQKNRPAWLLFLWTVASPISAALSRDSVSGVRSLSLCVPLCIVAGIGLAHLVQRKLLVIPFFLISLLLIFYYFEFYILHQGFYSGAEWVSPYAQAFKVVKANYPTYSHIYFTDKLGQPYIFALFYMKVDPSLYQTQAKLVQNQSGDVGTVLGFDKFKFGPIFWPSLRGETNALFIGGQYELPEKDLNISGLSRISDIYYPDGTHALRIIGIQKT